MHKDLEPNIHELIERGYLTIDQATSLRPDQSRNLMSGYITTLVTDNRLSIEQALGLSCNQRWTLMSASVYKLIINNLLSIEQAMALDPDQARNLMFNDICNLIIGNLLSIEQAMVLDRDQRYNLVQIAHLEDVDQARLDPAMVQRIIHNELAIEDTRANPVPPTVYINTTQSTHTASVHPTASESASRFWQRYRNSCSVRSFRLFCETPKIKGRQTGEKIYNSP